MPLRTPSSIAVTVATLLPLLLASEDGGRSDASASTHRTVAIRSERFTPDSILVERGDTVLWRNVDIVRHTVTQTGGAFDSGRLRANGTFTWIAPARGRYEYYCLTHRAMKGVVVVR
jgi:plastocyanin